MQAKENLAIAAATKLPPMPSAELDPLHYSQRLMQLQHPAQGNPNVNMPCSTDKMQTHFSLFLLCAKQALHIPSAYFSSSSFSAYFQEYVLHMEAYITHKRPGKFCGMKSLGEAHDYDDGDGAFVCGCILCTRAVMLIFQSPLVNTRPAGIRKGHHNSGGSSETCKASLHHKPHTAGRLARRQIAGGRDGRPSEIMRAIYLPLPPSPPSSGDRILLGIPQEIDFGLRCGFCVVDNDDLIISMLTED